ncbi:hypothetical protein [Streptomyces sp. NPDC049970]|uniref:hypothetical protein n=1 Tax=Streptomyces sp. NPDC049970 TaxID=3155033 RepID=UPI003425484B
MGNDLVTVLDDTSKTTVKALRRNVGGKKKGKKSSKKRLRRIESQISELNTMLHALAAERAAKRQ